MNLLAPTAIFHSGEMRVVHFQLEKMNFAADVEEIQAICWASPIIPTPDMPDYVEGELYLRDFRVPVINLRQLLGLAPRRLDEDMRILVMQTSKGPVGMLVDKLHEVIKLPPGAVMPPSKGHPVYVSAVVPGCNLLLPDFERLMDGLDESYSDEHFKGEKG